jgi:DNA primase
MFGLPNLSPWIAGGALAVGLLIGGAGTSTWYEKIIVPGRENVAAVHATQTANATCEINAAIAANEARAVAQANQAQAIEFAFEQHRKAAIEAAQEHLVQTERLEQEIADYEKKIAAEGGACPLDERALEFLRSRFT